MNTALTWAIKKAWILGVVQACLLEHVLYYGTRLGESNPVKLSLDRLPLVLEHRIRGRVSTVHCKIHANNKRGDVWFEGRELLWGNSSIFLSVLCAKNRAPEVTPTQGRWAHVIIITVPVASRVWYTFENTIQKLHVVRQRIDNNPVQAGGGLLWPPYCRLLG